MGNRVEGSGEQFREYFFVVSLSRRFPEMLRLPLDVLGYRAKDDHPTQRFHSRTSAVREGFPTPQTRLAGLALSPAENLTLNTPPKILPIGRNGFTGIDSRTPALDFY